MRTILLWAMLLIAWAAQADEGLYGQWKGITPATEFESEATITLLLEESDSFGLILASDIPLEEAALFWQDFEVEGPRFKTMIVDINGVFHVQGDSLLFEIYDFYMHLEDEDGGFVELFDVLVQAMIESMVAAALVEEVGDDERALIEELVPPLVGLMRLSMIEAFSSELSGPYTLEGNMLHLGAVGEEDTLTLFREGSTPTGVGQVSWGQLKNQF